MADLFEKSVNLGLGLFMYSKERIEEFVDELVGKGEIARKDARSIATDLIKKGEAQREELAKLVQKEVSKALKYADIAQKKDILTKAEIQEIVRESLKAHGLTEETKKE